MTSTLNQREIDIELIDLATVEHFVNFIIIYFVMPFVQSARVKNIKFH